MRRSEIRHVLALVRRELNMEQADLAALVGCSTATVKSIELERLRLSDSLAMKIYTAMGVSIDWLKANDTTRPPEGRFGVPYTNEYYEGWRAAATRDISAFSAAMIPAHLFAFYGSLRRMLMKVNSEKMALVDYRMEEFLKELADVTGPDPQTHIAAGNTLFDLIGQDLKTAKKFSKMLRGKSGHVSALPEVQAVASEVKERAKQFLTAG